MAFGARQQFRVSDAVREGKSTCKAEMSYQAGLIRNRDAPVSTRAAELRWYGGHSRRGKVSAALRQRESARGVGEIALMKGDDVNLTVADSANVAPRFGPEATVLGVSRGSLMFHLCSPVS